MLLNKLKNIFNQFLVKGQSLKQELNQQASIFSQTLKGYWQVPQMRYPFMISIMTFAGVATMSNFAFPVVLGAGVFSAGLTYLTVEGLQLFYDIKQTVQTAKNLLETAKKKVEEEEVTATLKTFLENANKLMAEEDFKQIIPNIKLVLEKINTMLSDETTNETRVKLKELLENISTLLKDDSKEIIQKIKEILANVNETLGSAEFKQTIPSTKDLIQSLNQLLVEAAAKDLVGKTTVAIEQGTKTLEQAEIACRTAEERAGTGLLKLFWSKQKSTETTPSIPDYTSDKSDGISERIGY